MTYMRPKLRVNDYLFLIVENTFITPTSCPNRTNETNTPVGNTNGSIKNPTDAIDSPCLRA